MSTLPQRSADLHPGPTFDQVRAALDTLDLITSNGGRQLQAHCPAHPDTRPSLSVGEGHDGLALITCHGGAGCDFREVLDALDFRFARVPPVLASSCSSTQPPTYLALRRALRGSKGLSGKPQQTRGIDAELDAWFDCVIPGRDHDHQAVIRDDPSRFTYVCADGKRGLAEVRASIAYREPKRLRPTEAARWRERLWFEAGLIKRHPGDWTVPPTCSPNALKIAGGIALLLSLRDKRWAGQPFTFARAFAAAWCDMSEPAVRQGIEELRDRGHIREVGRRRCGPHDLIEWQCH